MAHASLEADRRMETLVHEIEETPGLPSRSAASRPDCELSVVVPLYNEEGNVALLVERLDRVLRTLPFTSEIILVDDGSRDGTAAEAKRSIARHPNVALLRFRRNFGQTAALAAGFHHARGDVVVTIDGDLQNPPEEIPKLLAKLAEGFDLVSGWRADRQDPFLRRVVPSKVANLLIGWITGVRLHDYGCSLKAYRREILEGLQIHGDMHRFLPAFAGAVGARIAEIPVRHAPRKKGQSKYGLLRTFIVMVDMLTIRFLLPCPFKPLKIFGVVGLALTLLGVAIDGYLAWLKLFAGEALAARPMLLLGTLLIVTGVQFIALGILAELQTRSLLNGGGGGVYVVLERLGAGQGPVGLAAGARAGSGVARGAAMAEGA